MGWARHGDRPGPGGGRGTRLTPPSWAGGQGGGRKDCCECGVGGPAQKPNTVCEDRVASSPRTPHDLEPSLGSNICKGDPLISAKVCLAGATHAAQSLWASFPATGREAKGRTWWLKGETWAPSCGPRGPRATLGLPRPPGSSCPQGGSKTSSSGQGASERGGEGGGEQGGSKVAGRRREEGSPRLRSLSPGEPESRA